MLAVASGLWLGLPLPGPGGGERGRAASFGKQTAADTADASGPGYLPEHGPEPRGPVPPGAGRQVLLADAEQGGARVAVAADGSRVLVIWVGAGGRLGGRISHDRGESWKAPPSLPAVRPATGSEVLLLGRLGTFHLLYAAEAPDGRGTLLETHSPAVELAWSAPRPVGTLLSSRARFGFAAEAPETRGHRMLAAWQAPGGAGLAVAWGDAGRSAWFSPEEPPGVEGGVAFVAPVVVDGRGLLLWSVAPSPGSTEQLFHARCGAPGDAWSNARPLPIETPGAESGYLTAAVVGARVILQWSEAWLTGGRGIRVASSDDELETVGPSRPLGSRLDNGRRSSLAVLGKRVWSVWEDRSNQVSSWATSVDGGSTWSPASAFWSWKRKTRAAAVAVGDDRPAWAAWPDDDGAIRVMQLW